MDKRRVKKILKKLFCLPPVPTLLVSVPSYGLVIYALARENVNPVVAYISYSLSAYAFIITVTGITGVVRFARQRIERHPLIKKLLGIPLASRYLKEDMFRAGVALYQGFLVNILYAVIKMFSGILYHSVWFITLAVYYILLAVMRASLIHYMRDNRKNQLSGWRRYLLCGIILMFMNIVLAGLVILVVHQDSGTEYPGMLIYVMALYAFYAAIMAVWNVVKYKRYGSPVMSASKAINLTAALVSMLSLETAMLAQFGTTGSPLFRKVMTASTGAGISLIVLGMAVFMIVRSVKQIKHIKQEKEI